MPPPNKWIYITIHEFNQCKRNNNNKNMHDHPFRTADLNVRVWKLKVHTFECATNTIQSNNWDFGYKHCIKRDKTCSNMLYTRFVQRCTSHWTPTNHTSEKTRMSHHIQVSRINQQITLIFHVNSNKRTLHSTPIFTIHAGKNKISS